MTTLYRQLQVMAVQYRLNYSRFMIGTIIPVMIAMETICLYNTVSFLSGRSTNDSSGLNLLYAWSGFMVLFNVIFMLGLLAEVFNVSTKVIRMMNVSSNMRKHSWFRRWLRSCQVLKIYFGGNNYLDRLTPLAVENFIIEQTASLLLLKNQKVKIFNSVSYSICIFCKANT